MEKKHNNRIYQNCVSHSNWQPIKPETYAQNDKTYILLRPITIKSLILDGARDEDIEYFSNMYPILIEISLQNAVEFCSKCSEKMKWMEEKGYWRVEEKRKVRGNINLTINYSCPFCSVPTCQNFNTILKGPYTNMCQQCKRVFEVEIDD